MPTCRSVRCSTLLQSEFPDITISKIRFLESQGLLDPERTPSGYRKFYEADVERLRWILRQQQEHFLPLKVIKGRLEPEEDADVADPGEPGRRRSRCRDRHRQTPPTPSPGCRRPAPAHRRPAPPTAGRAARPQLSAGPSGGQPDHRRAGRRRPACRAPTPELERSACSPAGVVGDTTYYDEEAVVVAKLAAGFLRFGVEARHLRMYRTAAEREAGFFEQVVMPMLKQRNPQARAPGARDPDRAEPARARACAPPCCARRSGTTWPGRDVPAPDVLDRGATSSRAGVRRLAGESRPTTPTAWCWSPCSRGACCSSPTWCAA